MKREWKWATYLSVLALVVGALLWTGPYSRGRRGADVSTTSHRPVGTAGHDLAPEPDDSPATLHDLETLTGSLDPHELIGSRVDFHLKATEVADDTSFWVGSKDNRMLVVLASNDTQPAHPGQMVRITGTIQGIPNAQARYSEGINDSLRRELKDQKVYIRADHVFPAG